MNEDAQHRRGFIQSGALIVEAYPVRPGVLGQAALSLADAFARVLLEKGLITQADYVRGYDLAIQEWEQVADHPQHHEVLAALRKIRPADDRA